MRKLFVLAAATGSLFIAAPAASAMPSGPDGPVPFRSAVVTASDPAPRVTKVVQPPPLPRVTVQNGDTLTAIGSRTARSWEQLASYNHIPNPNLIFTGQVVVIPPASFVAGPVTLPTPPAPQSAPPAPNLPTTRTYTPQPSVSVSSSGWSGPWACISHYESGGNPATDTGNGYYGGLQFSLSTWQANGGSGNPANASIAEQEAVANHIVAASGGSYGAWPNTSVMCGL
jgi:resuscitation-promoting factor RpfE